MILKNACSTGITGDTGCLLLCAKGVVFASGDAVRELKDMVKACHKAGIEVVLEMPFTGTVPKQMIEECLRYYMMEYHVDGFILNPVVAPMEGIYADPVLKDQDHGPSPGLPDRHAPFPKRTRAWCRRSCIGFGIIPEKKEYLII